MLGPGCTDGRDKIMWSHGEKDLGRKTDDLTVTRQTGDVIIKFWIENNLLARDCVCTKAAHRLKYKKSNKTEQELLSLCGILLSDSMTLVSWKWTIGTDRKHKHIPVGTHTQTHSGHQHFDSLLWKINLYLSFKKISGLPLHCQYLVVLSSPVLFM